MHRDCSEFGLLVITSVGVAARICFYVWLGSFEMLLGNYFLMLLTIPGCLTLVIDSKLAEVA